MARTRGAAAHRFHQDDGVVLGKGGVLLPTVPLRGIPSLNPHGAPTPEPLKLVHMDDGEVVLLPEADGEIVTGAPTADFTAPPAAEPRTTVYLFDRTTWGKNVAGHEVLELLSVILGREVSLTLPEDEFKRLSADARQRFRRVSS